jgi:small GTP-binding protein
MGEKISPKLILVGSSGVGKTSLVGCFFHQQFDSRALPTVAPAFCTASVTVGSGRTIELQIWDTAGQEQYQSISQMFYRDSNIAFICFNEAEFSSIQRWVDRVNEFTSDCQVYLVGTQVDLLDTEGMAEFNAKVTKAADEQKVKFFMTSAKTGKGVLDLFQYVAGEVSAASVPTAPVVNLMGDGTGTKGGGKSCPC